MGCVYDVVDKREGGEDWRFGKKWAQLTTEDDFLKAQKWTEQITWEDVKAAQVDYGYIELYRNWPNTRDLRAIWEMAPGTNKAAKEIYAKEIIDVETALKGVRPEDVGR